MHAERSCKLSFPVVGIVVAAALWSTDASAFCRTRTVATPPDFDPAASCFRDGVALYHPSQCLPYRLVTRASPTLPNAVLSDVLARSFAEWTRPNAHCSPGISTIELEPVDRERIVSYAAGQRGDNIVGFVSPWPHGGGQTLALATLTFSAATGEIYDVDLEINQDVRWSTSDSPTTDDYDLQSALTHEAGHVLAFAHSSDTNATMWASYNPGSIEMRSLEDDDMLAVCDAFPTRFSRTTDQGLVPATACQLAPGAAGDGCGDAEIGHGCSVAAMGIRGIRGIRGGAVATARTPASALGLLTVLAMFARRRGRRRIDG